jgi:hypothetical protein
MRDQLDSIMRSSYLIFHVILALLFSLSYGAKTSRAFVATVAADGGFQANRCNKGKPTAINGFAGDGLIFVASDACEFENQSTNLDGTIITFSGASYATVYGSDTSWNLMLADKFAGKSLEPMAQVMAAGSASGNYDGGGGAGVGAYACIQTTHRIVERPGNPYPQNSIPANVKFRISNTLEGVGSTRTEVRVVSGGSLVCNQILDQDGEVDDICTTTSSVGTNITISTCTEVSVDLTHGAGSAQAVGDPFLEVDPAWEYAQYFVAKQESVLVLGEWKEVTRDWKYFCECDIESDGDVDGSNLYAFMQDFGRTECSGGCSGDLNGDGKVDDEDLLIFTTDFGKINCK